VSGTNGYGVQVGGRGRAWLMYLLSTNSLGALHLALCRPSLMSSIIPEKITVKQLVARYSLNHNTSTITTDILIHSDSKLSSKLFSVLIKPVIRYSKCAYNDRLPPSAHARAIRLMTVMIDSCECINTINAVFTIYGMRK
jgi:hypothetical protein